MPYSLLVGCWISLFTLFLGGSGAVSAQGEVPKAKARVTSQIPEKRADDAGQPDLRGDSFYLRIPTEMVFRRVSPKKYEKKGADYFLLETEVTNVMYADYLKATKRSKGDEKSWQKMMDLKKRTTFSTTDPCYFIRDKATLWSGNNPPRGKEEHPVTVLDVHEGAAFCEWLTNKYPKFGTFRFPTDEEWLVAAYGSDRKYPWGNDWDANRVCSSVGKTVRTSCEPVRSRPAGRTPEGLYGMWGNASEFIIHPSGLRNVLFVGVGARWLGGSFANESFKPRQAYWGYTHSSDVKYDEMGFRVLLDVTDKEHRFKHRVPYDREEP